MPQLPARRPAKRAPCAWAASSIRARPCRPASAARAAMSAIWPNRWTAMTAAVRRADRRGDRGRVDQQRVGQDVDEPGRRARPRRPPRRSRRRCSRDDHLVAGPDPQAGEDQLERVGAVGDPDAGRALAVRGELVLERVDLRAADEAAVAQHRLPGPLESRRAAARWQPARSRNGTARRLVLVVTWRRPGTRLRRGAAGVTGRTVRRRSPRGVGGLEHADDLEPPLARRGGRTPVRTQSMKWLVLDEERLPERDVRRDDVAGPVGDRHRVGQPCGSSMSPGRRRCRRCGSARCPRCRRRRPSFARPRPSLPDLVRVQPAHVHEGVGPAREVQADVGDVLAPSADVAMRPHRGRDRHLVRGGTR